MQVCNILLVDSEPDVRILKELQEFYKVPVEFRSFSRIDEAIMSAKLERPDLILIASRFLLDSGAGIIRQLSTSPLIILCEADNFRNIFKGTTGQTCFITRPLELEKIIAMIEKAYAFWLYSSRRSRELESGI